MPKIRVEIEVPEKYCDVWDNKCPFYTVDKWGDCYCTLFNDRIMLENERYYSERCDECKQAEVEDNDTNRIY